MSLLLDIHIHEIPVNLLPKDLLGIWIINRF